MYPRILFTVVASGLLGACATLPSSGPTGGQIVNGTAAVTDGEHSKPAIEIVEIDDVSALPAETPPIKPQLTDLAPPPTDMIGPGDVLAITIYEAGVPLFGGGAASLAGSRPGAFDPGVKAQPLPATRVDDNGDIVVPYAGKLRIIGKTPYEVQEQIRGALRGISQDPQILVSLAQVLNNTVMVGGEINRPGRLVLQTNRERLSDIVALAGGQRGAAKDLTLRIERGASMVDMRLSDLFAYPDTDVRAYPGDRLSLIFDPLSYSVLGAPGRVEQLPFLHSSMSLAEAIASAGGANPGLGDPAAIFVLRYVSNEDGTLRPVVYHLNMMETRSFFLAQKFAMHDKDILYFGNAKANQPSKLVQLVSQLFSPILTATSMVQVLQNN